MNNILLVFKHNMNTKVVIPSVENLVYNQYTMLYDNYNQLEDRYKQLEGRYNNLLKVCCIYSLHNDEIKSALHAAELPIPEISTAIICSSTTIADMISKLSHLQTLESHDIDPN